MSIEVSQIEGYKVFIVNLESKEVENIFPTEEVVSNPVWSPQGHSLAYSKGRIAENNVVIFEELDSKQQKILSESYISIAGLKWDSNGEFFDYIAESPSNIHAFYRYDLKTNELVNYGEVTRDQFLEWME